MEKPLVSIIVPVYNAEKYISECIDSILSQTYTNFELILINDGSIDKSGIICDRYAQKDKRIIVIHKKNGGVSSARNIGLEKVTGEYLLFVDADDKIYSNCLKTLTDEILEHNLDVLQFLHSRSKKYPAKDRKYGKILNAPDFIKLRCNISAAGSFIKTSIIKNANIKFNENIKLAEDQMFILQCILSSKKCEFINKELYYYRINENSATATGKAEDMLKSCKYLLDFKRLNPLAAIQIDNTILYFIYSIITSTKMNYRNIVYLYKECNIRYYNQSTKGRKLLYYLTKFNITSAFYIINKLYKLKHIIHHG